jgi:Glycosyltransferase Family 4
MQRALKVLLTNIWLANRGGSEIVTRDLALGLLRRGHRPIVYAASLGEPAEELRAAGVAVIDDLRLLGERPDILHAHHAIPCGEALMRFPDLPAIQVCHAFALWMEAPAHFPQIGAYVAVDEACRDRLVHSEGIDPARVVEIPNAVELRRIPDRARPLGPKPLRAVAFGKAAAAEEIRIACERMGLAFEAIGAPEGRALAAPEQEIVNADIVFASARCALEALCCGCAVVVCDARGFAGKVTAENYPVLRARNFGLRSFAAPTTIERCCEAIRAFDANEARRAAALARQDADLESALDRYEALYAEVLDGARRPVFGAEQHAAAVERFLHEALPRRPGDARFPESAGQHALQARIDVLERELSLARCENDRVGHAAEAWQHHAAQLQRELGETREARDAAARELVEARAVRDATARGLAEETTTHLRAKGALERLSAELATMRRSRLFRLGQFLRRAAGRPTVD